MGKLFRPLLRPPLMPVLRPPLGPGWRSGAAVDALTAWLAGATYADWNPTIIGSMAQNSDGTTPVTTNGDPVGRILDQGPGGFNATQATAGSRPAYQSGNLDGDGTDDNLLTTWLCGAAGNTVIMKVAVAASVPGLVIPFGTLTGSDRFAIGIQPGAGSIGILCGAVGAQSVSVIKGTKDLRGKTVVIALSASGSLVELFAYADALVTTEYSAAQSGAPTTEQASMLCALNISGSVSNPYPSAVGRTISAQKAMTLAEFTAIAPLLAA